MRDGRAVTRVASVLDRYTEIDQWACFIQWSGADVLNKVDASVGLVALLCSAASETDSVNAIA